MAAAKHGAKAIAVSLPSPGSSVQSLIIKEYEGRVGGWLWNASQSLMEEKIKSIVVQQAAQWFARMRAPDCCANDRAEFQRWLAQSAVHEQAYAAVARTAERVSNAADPRLKRLAALAVAPSTPGALPHSGRRDSPAEHSYGLTRRLQRCAAGFVVAASLLVFVVIQGNEPPQHSEAQQRYVNEDKRRQRITLDDGTVMFLDVGAAVTVEMTDQKRRVALNRGRAYFDVAHESSRAFSVHAAGTEVVALGTRFEVDITPDGLVDVTLAEGSVAVTYQQPQQRASEWRNVLRPGDQLTVDEAGRRQSRTVNADAVISWSRGLLVFDDTPLHRVLEEINRYAEVKVRLSERSLGDIAIGGNFAAGGDSSEFVRTLTTALPLKSIRTGPDEIVLFPDNKSRFPN